MPIKARIDMLSTGIRTPVGLKVSGADLKEIERIGTEIEAAAALGARHPQRVRGADGRRASSSTSSGTATRWHATA